MSDTLAYQYKYSENIEYLDFLCAAKQSPKRKHYQMRPAGFCSGAF